MNINQKNLEAILKLVSNKIGTTPEILKKQLESGKLDAALNGMNAKDSAKFQQFLKNPKLMEQFMSSEQAQALYKKLTGEK